MIPAESRGPSPAARGAMEDFAAVPADLRDLNRWVVWRLETRNSKPTKVPYTAHTGRPNSPPCMRSGLSSLRRPPAKRRLQLSAEQREARRARAFRHPHSLRAREGKVAILAGGPGGG